MRLLVCGSRNWKDYATLKSVIEELAPNVIIEGEARGADLMGRHAGHALGIPVEPFPADWDRHGKAAGHIRNTKMLKEGKPTLVAAFSKDIVESRGTSNMLTQAEDAGIPYFLVEE